MVVGGNSPAIVITRSQSPSSDDVVIQKTTGLPRAYSARNDGSGEVTWQPGWVTLLHGANGAGKTTWLRQLAASWAPVYYSGHTLGWIPHLTVAENMRLWEKVYGKHTDTSSDIQHLTSDTRLWGDLSQGQKQYIAFVGAQLSGCTLWLMDEPFAHMDAAYTNETQEMCRQHCSKGGALVLTSHAPNIDFWPHVQAWLVG